jgi:YidC/Oxa1 family membrane protein insertase
MDLSFIENILIDILKYLYSYTSNWGLAIIMLTIIVKTVLFPLTLKQDQSARGMRKLAPEIEKLREQYKSKPEELNKKTMELYQKNKVNPLGGCLPLLLQMPIWIALFQVLSQKHIITNETFIIWQLTVKDPFYILPVLTGVVTFLQTKLSSDPSQNNNEQIKMMNRIMPVMIVVMNSQFAAGLQIYWFTSTLFSVLQSFILLKRGEMLDKKEKELELQKK